MKVFTENDVDRWVDENNEPDANRLLDELLPKHRAKLKRVDKQIINILAEIREVFPDAEYYTASGGFNLMLGKSHNHKHAPQQQRMAWGGFAHIGDGDF